MKHPRPRREIPLRYDDGFRGGVAMLCSLPVMFAPLAVWGASPEASRSGTFAGHLLVAGCGAFTLFFLIYLLWTHRVFSGTDPDRAAAIAAMQHRLGASGFSRVMGLRSAEEWGIAAVLVALLVSVAAVAVGSDETAVWLPVLVFVTIGASWATVVYAFALRYFRLHAAGETISFDIAERPVFSDFLSMAVMVSSVGAMSAGTPRTRGGLVAVRTHTFISFAFNAFVVAMAVSLITGLISAG